MKISHVDNNKINDPGVITSIDESFYLLIKICEVAKADEFSMNFSLSKYYLFRIYV